MAILIIFLRCHTVATDAILNDRVFPETRCTTHEVITAEMAASHALYVLMDLHDLLQMGHVLTLLAHEKHAST